MMTPGTRLPKIGDRLDVTVENSDLIQSATVVAIDEDTITLQMDVGGEQHQLPLARCTDLVWYDNVGQA